ncbi:MAG: DUF4126 domain-containing protein [Anaerolineales bacterium]|nr:DUF4126 domain-containing protein [Anaerolineales bacterium]
MDIFTAFGLSASAGLNAYIPLLVVSLVARFTDWIELSQPWDTLESWWVIGILAVLSLVEFFADKIPAVNHVNDILQTFVRPVAGAVVFAASAQVAEVHPVLAMAAGLLIAGSVHAAKSAAIRPVVTATTGGAGNIPVSILEDITSTLLSILAIIIPILVAVIMILLTSLIIWWMWRRANRKPLVQ